MVPMPIKKKTKMLVQTIELVIVVSSDQTPFAQLNPILKDTKVFSIYSSSK